MGKCPHLINKQMSMNIGLDATLLREDRVTGIEKYTINLIKSLVSIDSNNKYTVFFKKKVYSELVPYSDKFDSIICSWDNRIYCDQLWLPGKLRNLKLDLIHYPAYPSSPFTRAKSVLTIHDATFWKFPATISKGGKFYYKPLFSQAIKRASKIITVSESSRSDLIKYLSIPEEKIITIYEALDPDFLLQPSGTDVKSKYKLPDKYILSVGTLEPRKNLSTLIKAFLQLKEKCDVPHKLVIVGRKGWIGELTVPDAVKEQVYFTGFVDKEDLPDVYKCADLFVFPSIYEGFGFPLLEAMAMEVPIVASNTSSLPEIGAKACLYADPNDPVSFTDKMIEVLLQPLLSQKLVAAGKDQVCKFSWDKTARETLSTYRQIK